MDKTQFLELIRHHAATSVDEATALAGLKAQFPYSQLIQTLAARASKDHSLQHQQRDLQVAAVYASDRALLKQIMTTQPEEPAKLVVSKHVDADARVAETIDSVDVADIIMDDLQRLAKLKHAFENLFSETSPKIQIHRSLDNSEVQEEEKVSLHPAVEIQKQSSDGHSASKSKKERIIELAKAMNKQNDMESEVAPKKKQGGRVLHPVDEIIAQIQSSKEELSPENERQKQQIEIINQFIRIQPSISKASDRAPAPVDDLMQIKSGEFGDNIVSETLVEILVKQGKKDKAVEVLKKLIWKYPQKKAYFASQIEDLKK